jgi:hypothetical protein
MQKSRLILRRSPRFSQPTLQETRMRLAKRPLRSKQRWVLSSILMGAALLSLGLLSGCARVTIKDSEWCGDLGSQGAACFHTLTSAEEDLPKAIWDIRRFGMVCTVAGTFADWKQDIEDLCSYSHDCDYQQQQEIEAFFKKVEQFQQKKEQVLKRMSEEERSRLTHP